MADEGFEYKPDTQSSGMATTTDFDDIDVDPSSRKFAEEYGYGIVDNPWMQETEGESEEPQEYIDPNEDYIKSLSKSEQQAYEEALWGPPQEWDESMEEEEYVEPDWTEQGCYGKANHELEGEQTTGYEGAMKDPEFTELFADMETISNKLWGEEADLYEEVIALNREWSTCLADAGYPDIDAPMNATNQLYEKYNELGMVGDEYKDPTAEQKQKFQQEEIKQAIADWECKDKVKYEKSFEKLNHDKQQEFVDANKAKLDALIAKYGVAKKK